MDEKNKKEQGNIYPPALMRSLIVIDYMAKVQTPVSIKELSTALDIPYSSVFRIVKCLADFGYLKASDNQKDRYAFGYKFLKFASLNADGHALNSIALPRMRDLVDKVSQTCQLSILDNKSLIIITQHIIPKNTVVLVAKIGEQLSINTCASGKLLFALLPEEDRIRYFPKALSFFTSNTKNTVTDPDKFLSQLDAIRIQGYSMDKEEYAIGIGCFSAPIYDFSGEAVAALTLTGPIQCYTDSATYPHLLEELFETCNKISSDLGYAGQEINSIS